MISRVQPPNLSIEPRKWMDKYTQARFVSIIFSAQCSDWMAAY